MAEPEWAETWNEICWEQQQRNPEFEQWDYYVSGRSSKAYPDKENPRWWADHGPQMVEDWTTWRENSGLKVAEFVNYDTGEVTPGIELEVWAVDPVLGRMKVRSIIDRVFVDADDNYRIVDLKSGSHTDPWPLQMALNNLGLQHQYGVSAVSAGYWKGRTGGVDKWHDLSRFTPRFLWSLVAKAYRIRDEQLFMPQPNNFCNSACGVREYCQAAGGSLFAQVQA